MAELEKDPVFVVGCPQCGFENWLAGLQKSAEQLRERAEKAEAEVEKLKAKPKGGKRS